MVADDHIGGPAYDPSLVIPRLPPPTGPGARTRATPPTRRRRGALDVASGVAATVLAALGLLAFGAAGAERFGTTIGAATVGDLYGDDLAAEPGAGPNRPAVPAPVDGDEPAPSEPTAPAERAEPVGIQISSIDVSHVPIRSVGLTEDGALEVPDETEIGWYRYGATAGASGATVLAAHVAWNGRNGPFFELGRLEPGATVEVTLDDGSTRHYEVVERALYGKTELPRDRIWRRTGEETLVLITCGGEFNPEIRRFRQNIVVYAVPSG